MSRKLLGQSGELPGEADLRRPPTRSWVLVALVVAAVGCVSRNVEEISSEEAAAIPPPPSPQQARAAVALNQISGVVEVAPELAANVPTGSVLYLIVRVAGREGGPPLAVRRIPTPAFPLEFVITEDDAMVPGTPLMGRVTVTARVDQDGDPLTDTRGDLRGQAGPVGVGAGGVTVTLSELVSGEDRP